MAENNNTLLEKLDGLVARFEEVSTLITDPNVIADQKRYVKLTKEYKDLNDIMKARREYIQCLNGLEEAKQIMANESDPEMREMAREEAECSAKPASGTGRGDQTAYSFLRTRRMTEMPFSRYAAVRVVTKPPFLPATSSACTPSIVRLKAGDWIYPAPTREQPAVSRKSSAP